MKKLFSVILVYILAMNLLSGVGFAIQESNNISIIVDIPKMTSPNENYIDTTGQVKIEIKMNENTDTLIRIIDPLGRIIYLESFLAQNNKGTFKDIYFSAGALEEGKYVVYVSDNTGKSKNSENQFIVKKQTTTKSAGGGGARAEKIEPTSAPKIDSTDPIKNDLLQEEAGKITTKEDAIKKINEMVKGVTEEQKKDSNTAQNAALVAEAMSRNIGSKSVKVSQGNKLAISENTISSKDIAKVEETIKAILKELEKNNYEMAREIDRELVLKVKFDSSNKATITISTKTVEALKGIDIFTIADENFRISFKIEMLKEELLDIKDGENLEITFEKVEVNSSSSKLSANNDSYLTSGEVKYILALAPKTATKLSFNKEKLKTNAYVSLPPPKKTNTEFQAMKKTDSNEIIGGKYNPATGMIEAPIGSGGTYVVEENKVDFTDISNKEAAMQEAIKVLAAKGIIRGYENGSFAPDKPITRGELVSLIVKTLYLQKGGVSFTDTKDSWYKEFAETARNAGVINGYEDNTFRGYINISREQVVAISARTLRNQKKYFDPKDVETYLNTFIDKANIPSWAKTDVSLASRENLIIKKVDGRFNGSVVINRGEVALILKRLFDKL